MCYKLGRVFWEPEDTALILIFPLLIIVVVHILFSLSLIPKSHGFLYLSLLPYFGAPKLLI
jgi:hypothetical protein